MTKRFDVINTLLASLKKLELELWWLLVCGIIFFECV